MTVTIADRKAHAADQPMPTGFRIRLDESARPLRPDLWCGGSPMRILRLTPAGQATMTRLRADGVRDPATARLARRLTDAGLAHPVPPAGAASVTGSVTVVVPVLDRASELDRCLRALGQAYPVVVVDDGSSDARAIAEVARRHGARLVRRDRNGGPAAARNDGLLAVETEFVAFVDSDCAPPAGCIGALVAHLADPAIAAVAPRITSPHGGLDLGARPGRVVARSRISYVPTAALLARTEALRTIARGDPVTGGDVFDPALRFGEDVDLVWRLHEAGWRVRYEPAVAVPHSDPARRVDRLWRRFRYGTSAAPLAIRHGEALAPLVLQPWATATVAALLARRPVLTAIGFAGNVHATRRALRAAEVPTDGTMRATVDATCQTLLGTGRYLTQFASPVLLAAVITRGRPGRRLAALALVLTRARHVADDVAYGAGVWTGCLRHRTSVPLRPARARPLRRTPPQRPPVLSDRGAHR